MRDICKIFGNNVRILREKKNMSQEELGFEVDLDKSTISKYEKGTRTPNLRVAQNIAAALYIDIVELLK